MVKIPIRDDRGQLLLVGAIGIALVVVGTVVLLNGLAFDDSISARSSDDALSGAERTVEMIETDLNALAREIRADIDSSSGNFVTAFRENVSLYSRHYTNLSFDNGIVYTDVRFSGAETLNGTIIQQWANTTNCDTKSNISQFRRGGKNCTEHNWMLAKNVTAVNEFNITVLEIQKGRDILDVGVSGSDGSTWNMTITSPPGNSSRVNISNGGRSDFYPENTEIRLRDDGWIAINGSREFEFASGVTKPFDIEFRNKPGASRGTAMGGTYYLDSAGDLGDASTASTQPEVIRSMTNPAVDIYYQRRDVVYNRTVVLNETGAR